MTWFKEYKLLLWKNFIHQKRRPISSIFEIVLPIFFVFILLLLRVTTIKSEQEGQISWPAFPLNNHVPLMNMTAEKWKVAYTKNSTYRELMSHVPDFLDVNVIPFVNESSLVNALVADEESELEFYLCGIIFDSDIADKEIKYRLRFPSKPRTVDGYDTSGFLPKKWNTQFVYPFIFEGTGPRSNNSIVGGPPPYYDEGFLSVQRAVDFAIIRHHNASFDGSDVDFLLERFPYPKRIRDPFIVVIQNSLPLLIMLSLVYSSLLIVRNIVYEKEKKLKESMKMMGLSNWLHWLAWFTKCFVFLVIPMIIITLMLCVKFGHHGKMLMKSDGSLIFVFFAMYSITSIMFCFFVSTLFYRANLAAAGGGILWFISYTPYFFLTNYYNRLSTMSKVLACFDFQIAMAFGANLIGRFEGEGSGVQWSNINRGVTIDESFTMGHVLFMLFFDAVIYGLLTWYIEGIFPGEYGIPKKWYFPFSRKYWCNIQETEDDKIQLVNEGFDDEENEIDFIDCSFIEKEPEGLKPGIRINNLSKLFKVNSETKVAVDKLKLNLFEGEITALLGHNGAGKTTTISMLTGLIPPTSGNAVINGYDILYDMGGIRRSLGICPQHNVLFDNLTVEEHLLFFSSLKGVDDKKQVQEEVDRMIESIGLLDKRHTLTKRLSGGMKRKLSVGIALVGNSKIVMLDEPTSGMDVSARRFTWDLLQRERHGRTILLTTHFMDEADVLGDRIAIMANGKVKCCGSSLFLKNKYGCGYHMVMVKSPSCRVNVVTDLIRKYVPTSHLESNVGLELSIILPSDYAHRFEELFTEIESRREELGISSYGASVTTLEEVFIKVGEQVENEESAHRKLFRQLSGKDEPSRFVPGEDPDSPSPSSSPSPNFNNDEPIFDASPIKNDGYKLAFQRWYAMFTKKMLHSRRHKGSIISQLLMPCIFVLISLIVVKTMPKESKSPPLTLDLNMFGDNYVAYRGNGSSELVTDLMNAIPASLKNTDSTPVKVPFMKNAMQQYLLDEEQIDLSAFNLNHPVAIDLDQNRTQVIITAWFNNEALHTPAVVVNTVTNALLLVYTSNKAARIVAVNHPLPSTTKESIDDLKIDPNGFQIGFSLCFGMSFLASSFIVFLVQERSRKAKHVQFVSGVDPVSYWTSAFLWDLINFIFPTLLVMILFVSFQENAYSGKRLGYVFMLIMLYGWAIIPLMYIFSFAFETASTAFTRMTILNVITGLATMLVIFILEIPSLNLLDLANALKWAFLALPNYNLGQGMVDLFNNYQSLSILDKGIKRCVDKYHSKEFCEQFIGSKLQYENNYLSWNNPGIGRYMIFLALEGFVFFGLVLLIEYEVLPQFYRRVISLCKSSATINVPVSNTNNLLDADVMQEKDRIRNQYRENDVLVLKDLSKVYSSGMGENLLAVDHLSLGVPHGECFGLLGQNGAGKTTTFKMLTGDESITEGSAYIDSFNVATDIGQVRQRMGYCPQFDALIDLMTGREILTMYSRLRGIPEKHIPKIVEDLAKSLTVDEYMDKVSKTYSGGNKRKLSTAIALIGDPSLIFLDEPSAGMDPVARRMLWGALSRVMTSGKSIVITSHSMEECEALCTRIAIMVNGQFKCLGSPQHLKNKFGEGYTLVCRVGGLRPDTRALKQFIEGTFPGSTVKDEHQGYLHYQLKGEKKTWANLFGLMESAKEEFNIEDYSVSQTTLEQVFMNFTRSQRVTDD